MRRRNERVYLYCKSLDLQVPVFVDKDGVYILANRDYSPVPPCAHERYKNMIRYNAFCILTFSPHFEFRSGWMNGKYARQLQHLTRGRDTTIFMMGYYPYNATSYLQEHGIQLFLHEHRHKRSLCIKVPKNTKKDAYYMKSGLGAETWTLSKLTNKNLRPLESCMAKFSPEEKHNFKTMLLSGGVNFDTALWLL